MKGFSRIVILVAAAIGATLSAQNRAPRLLTKVEPVCTAAANGAKTQGTVVVTVTIDHNGTPQNIRVVRGLDFGLSDKAVEAVEQWRFEPGVKDGRPAGVDVTIEVNFQCPMVARTQAPRLLIKVAPDCSIGTGEARAQGTVVLKVTIDDKGIPGNIRIVRGFAPGFDENAIEAAKQWRFEPATKDGRPVSADATIEVNFRC